MLCLVLIGLLTHHAVADCTLNCTNNVDCTSHPYKSTNTPGGITQCCAGCQKDSSCAAFTFIAEDGYACRYTHASEISNIPAGGNVCCSKVPLPPPPPAPPPPPYPLHALDCDIRRLALEYAGKALNGRGQEDVFEALQLGPTCHDSPPPVHTPLPSRSHSQAATAPVTLWVDPVKGSDSNAGTSAAQAWKTIHRAVAALGQQSPASRPATTINMLPGTHRINQTITLSAAHSGPSASAPVTFRASDNEGKAAAPGSVILSGGVSLDGLTWKQDASSPYYYTQLPFPVHWPFKSLFASGQRQWRARWPNGNPETYCARDLHGGHCRGYAQVGKTVTKGKHDSEPLSPNPNVKIFAKESGNLIAEGLMYPLNKAHEFHVATPGPAWHARKKTFSTFKAFKGKSLDRFDSTFTYSFFDTMVPPDMYIRKDDFSNKTWANPTEANVHIYQEQYWGNWGFKVSGVDTNAGTISFSEGGWQENRGGTIGGTGGRGIAQDYFVENVFEELDDFREWYFNKSTNTLYWIPETGQHPSTFKVEAPTVYSLIHVQGANQSSPAKHIAFVGLELRSTLPTFMLPYEPGNGGDWAVHRDAAVLIENANDVHVTDCQFLALEGNGAMMSQWVRDSSVTGCDFISLGDSPVVLFGHAELMDGRSGSQPRLNTVSNNLMSHFGVWGRQTAGIFFGAAGHNTASFNVIHDGPRPGINFNDGLIGGNTVMGNLLFNVVLDTGEHGSTNSWDRVPFLWNDDSGELHTAPDMINVVHNFIFRSSFRGPTSNLWALDKDDGSSSYFESFNVIVHGAIKDRDGLNRSAVGNLFLFPDGMPYEDTTHNPRAMVFQVNEYQWDSFVNNTVFSLNGEIYGCSSSFAKAGSPIVDNNTFYTPLNKKRPFDSGTCLGKQHDFTEWQNAGFDKHSELKSDATFDQIIAMTRKWLPL